MAITILVYDGHCVLSFRRKPKVAARGEASRRKRRTPFLREEAEGRKQVRFLPKEGRPSLPSESRHPARGEAFRRKRRTPPEVKLPEGRPSFGRTPFLREDALFSKQVQKAEGRAFFKTSSLPSASFGKPPEVKLPEGRSEPSCFLREPLALPSGRASS